MVVKTRDGWATNKQIAAQEAAWKKARKSLMTKLGPEAVKSAEATKARGAEIFKEMDADGNGSIDASELKAAFNAVGVELTPKELKSMMHEADRDGDGFIDAEEFENCELLVLHECVRPPFLPAPPLRPYRWFLTLSLPLPPIAPLRASSASQRGAPMESHVHVLRDLLSALRGGHGPPGRACHRAVPQGDAIVLQGLARAQRQRTSF